jgi:hypothetical protein
MGLQLIETSRDYSGGVRLYQASVFSALSSILEALSGILLELGIHKNVSEKEGARNNVFYEEIKTDNPLFSTKRYLHECLKLLTSKKETSCGRIILTAMECRAQTFSFEMAALAKQTDRDNNIFQTPRILKRSYVKSNKKFQTNPPDTSRRVVRSVTTDGRA